MEEFRIVLADACKIVKESSRKRVISGADEDGRVMVEFSEPVGGRRVKMLTPDEINGMLYKEETSESPANAEEAMAEETEPPTAGQEESGESALERIPKDAQTGEPQYTQTDADTAWDAIVEQTEGDKDMARYVAESTMKAKEEALKKLESSEPKAGATVTETIVAAKEHKAAIAAARQELEQWKAIAEVENRRKAEEKVVSSVPAVGNDISNDTVEVQSQPEVGNSMSGNSSEATSSTDKVSESSKTKQEKAENSISAKVKEASADVNTATTEAQKEAGNYKKGHVQVGTFDITIEQPQGSVRKGTDADGKQWESRMHNTYGYFRGTEGVDGDHIDVFLSNDIDGWNGRKLYVVDQYNPDGTFDEHKMMLGFNDMDEAKGDYLANYEKGWEDGRRIVVSATNLEDFEKWIDSSHRKTKPFAEYAGVKKETETAPKAGNVQKEEEPKPVGKGAFGDVYDQFRGKAKEAVEFLMRKKGGYLKGVFHRKEIGDIDLAWGEAHNPYNGKGLAHIIKKHVETLKDFPTVEDAVNTIIDVIDNGTVKNGKAKNTFDIEKGNYRVVIAADKNGNWVLTAFD